MIKIGHGIGELEVSPIGFGCMGLTAFYGDRTDDVKALEVLREAYDRGVRHFDTAQVYASKDKNGTTHYNEELVGKFLKSLSAEERESVSVATKFYPMNAKREFKFDEEHFVKATKESLKRLGVECIDLYYFHRIFPEKVCPLDVWMGAAVKLVKDGLVKRIGLSEASADVIRAANKIHPITCVQQEWSLFARDLEKSIVPTCKELNIGIICYSPIGRGFLAGSFAKKEDRPTDWRKDIPYLSEENIEKNFKILNELKEKAKAKGCTVGQLCLAWLIAQGGVPIPGTTKIKHVVDNCGAVFVSLNAEEIAELGKLGDQVVGERGNESYMKSTFGSL